MQSGVDFEGMFSEFSASDTGKLISNLRDYLQKNIVWIFSLFILGFVCFYSVVGSIIGFLTEGNQIPDGASIIVTSPMELILLKLRLSAMVSFSAVALLLISIASFKAQKYGFSRLLDESELEIKFDVSILGIILVICSSLILGLLGLAYSWEILTPMLLDYLTNDAINAGISSEWKLESYVGFIANLCIASVIGFQAPIPTLLLLKYKVVERKELIGYRRHIWFACIVGGAFFSPPDPLSLFLVSIPIIALFEFSILLHKLFVR